MVIGPLDELAHRREEGVAGGREVVVDSRRHDRVDLSSHDPIALEAPEVTVSIRWLTPSTVRRRSVKRRGPSSEDGPPRDRWDGIRPLLRMPARERSQVRWQCDSSAVIPA